MKKNIMASRDYFKRISVVAIAIALVIILTGTRAQTQEVITLGKLGTEGELIYPRQAQEGPDGNIYVYDQSDAFIKVYSPGGSFLRKIGGKGQGRVKSSAQRGSLLGLRLMASFFSLSFSWDIRGLPYSSSAESWIG